MPKIIPDVGKKILDAAVAMYHEEGYEHISMRKIASRCDLAVGTVYNQYEDKQALLAQVLAHDVEQIKTCMMEQVFGKPPAGALRSMIRCFIEKLERESHDVIRYALDYKTDDKLTEKILAGACSQVGELTQQVIVQAYTNKGVELDDRSASQISLMALSMMRAAAESNMGSLNAKTKLVYDMLMAYAERKK